MASERTLGTGPGAAHRRRRSKASVERLRGLGEDLPDLNADELRSIARERAARVGRYVFGAVAVMLVAAFVGVQWFRPAPFPVFRSAVPMSVRLPGVPPSLPWPTARSEERRVGKEGRSRSSPY